MNLRAFRVMVTFVLMFLITGILYAANGDLIVNGNLGVGTTTPAGKAEVNGNMVVDGNLGVGTTSPTEKAEIKGNMKVDGTITNSGETVNGNLCVGGNCTNSLHVSGGVYGYCVFAGSAPCPTVQPPATCPPSVYYGYTSYNCTCPTGYITVQTGSTGTGLGMKSYFACYKN